MPAPKAPWLLPLKKRALDCRLYGHADYVPFLVLGRSRVGSNLLRGLLNAHPQITAFGEIFRDPGCFDWDHTGYFQSSASHKLLARDPVRFLDERVFGRYPRTTGAVGFKIFYYHARDGSASSVWQYLRERRDLRVIHLKRENLLQTHVSRKRAALTSRWVNTTGQPDAAESITLDYEQCLDDFRQTRAWERQGDDYFSGHLVLPVRYEPLAADPGAEATRIQEFLGIRPHDVVPTTTRQSHQPLSRTISNYAVLKEQFTGTEWERFFTE